MATNSTTLSLIFVFAALLTACGPSARVALVGTPDVDSVMGKLELEEAEGELLLLTAVLRELPAASSVHPDATRFVAWVTDETGTFRVLGEVRRDPVERVGRIGATLAERRFLFQVTAEGEASPEEPSPHVVVRRQVEAEPK